MQISRIGIVSAGEMGSAVARVLGQGGFTVLTCLAGRSEHSRSVAAQSGMKDTKDLSALLSQSDVVLSIIPPSSAVDFAQALASAAPNASSRPLFVEMNAISPQKAKHIEDILREVGIDMVDGSIIGGPPKDASSKQTRFYLSGARAQELLPLARSLDVRVLSDVVGAASGLKMCYASISKGLTALGTGAFTAAESLSLLGPLRAELQATQPFLDGYFERSVPAMCPKAYRWVGEMDEIGDTLAQAGLPDGMLRGAAHTYAFVGGTALGAADERGARHKPGDMRQVLEALAAAAEAKTKAP